MPIERTDTRSGIIAGKYKFTVASTPEKGVWGKSANYYEFHFLVEGAGKYSEKIPVWKAGSLLRAIGAKEIETDVFEWDRDAVVGIQFQAEIGPEEGKDGKTYNKLQNPVALPGFPKDLDLVVESEVSVPF